MHLAHAVLSCVNKKFGIAVDEETVREVDDPVSECDDLRATDSEIVKATLIVFVQSEPNHAKQVREVIIQKRKDAL